MAVRAVRAGLPPIGILSLSVPFHYFITMMAALLVTATSACSPPPHATAL